MSAATTLRGLTWNHTRGYVPLVAASQAYADRRPDVDITWERRSLSEFGEAPLDALVEQYDLLVIDHPFVGHAAKRGLFVPLDVELPAAFLTEQRQQSVGPSFESYSFDGHQWALAIDAAAQVSAARPDLLSAGGSTEPGTWDDVVALARETGKVGMPLMPIDTLSALFSICAGRGDPAFRSSEHRLCRDETAAAALRDLRALFEVVGERWLQMNPIRTLNLMASTDDVAYVPLVYAYSNYSRDAFAPHLVAFGDVPSMDGGEPRGATLGGAGLAVSASSPHAGEAVEFASFTASAECQRTVYVLAGGQPGNRVAWEDDLANEVTHGFFRRLLPTLERAYLRPTFDGFEEFQKRAGPLLNDFLSGARGQRETIEELNRLAAAARR